MIEASARLNEGWDASNATAEQ